VFGHDLGEAIVHFTLGNSKNDLTNDRRGLEYAERMKNEGLPAERKELFRHRAAHAKPSPGGWHKGND
jgi:hypothetical protein